MGKASSSKKVARAARAGGSSGRQVPKLGFPLALFVIVVLGSLLVVYARSTTTSAASPTLQDHWHAAYGVYVCDTFLDNLPQPPTDPKGIHTHGDGVIHIHPFTSEVTGSRATMQVFADTVGIEFHSDGFTMPNGTSYRNGHDCNGQPAEVRIYRWLADDPSVEPDVFKSNFGAVQFTADRQAFTIAVAPAGAEVPRPPTIPTLDNLSDVDPVGAPSTTAPLVPGTTSDGSATLPTDGSTPAVSGDTQPTMPTPAGETPPITEAPPATEAPAPGTP